MLFTYLISSLLAALVYGQATQVVDSVPSGAPVVDLGYATYLGYVNETSEITYYRGIQYAQAPIGPLRWQKPHAIEASNEYDGATLNATTVAPICYGSLPRSIVPANFPGIPGGSEDCLILDVLVPNRPRSTRLPVIVQIHGGGYTFGSAQSYPGDALVHSANGSVVYVSIQYRLGLFGFLGGSQVAENGVLNAGLLDQRAALEWVQRNVRSFGGDPARVTIWGGSAGGGSVTLQLMAAGAVDTPPFSAAIAEYPWWQPLLNVSQQESQYYNTLRLSNCSSIDCLRSLSSQTLETLNQQVQDAAYPSLVGYGSFYFGPVVDGRFVKELPDTAFKLGHFYDVPLLVDHEAYEGNSFTNVSLMSQVVETMDAKNLFPFAGPAFFSRLYQLYPRSDFNSTFYQRAQWFGDFSIDCPTYFMASQAVNHNSNSSAVFKLTFAAGAQTHASTAPFLANADIDYSGANNRTLADIMTAYWVSFAVNHDPNPGRSDNAPYWPSYHSGGEGDVENGESVGFTDLAVTYTTIGPQVDPDANPRCEFLGNNGYVIRN
ncbi:hypothetical protein LTR78_006609 [Recurvomyces mirabilis]|uniref:Carboxylic ester hydrolase n=1 Tax=Recurvomyces mirabilis TaxID=574656 RepID=A0AAE0WKG3_9PEZI|nr:hypothetical protein LTR78_006609 [Recurvomyces mirabilis]KAK5151500.1 hypothetical protein LTS14_009344 [Recurvomyces mirabilis]